MALSDSCARILNELAKELVDYSDFGYEPKQVCHIVDALFSLASFVVGQDLPPDTPNTDHSLGISRTVIGTIPGVESDGNDAEQASGPAIAKLLADVSKVHPRLRKGLDDVYAELVSRPDHVLTQIDPDIRGKLEAVLKHQG